MKIISIANTTFHLKISEHVLDVLVLCACIILKMHKSMWFLSIIELITNTGLKSFQRPLATVPQPFTSRIHLTYLISLLFTNGKIKYQKRNCGGYN